MIGEVAGLLRTSRTFPQKSMSIVYVVNEPISALLAYAAEARPLYEMILAAMNESGI